MAKKMTSAEKDKEIGRLKKELAQKDKEPAGDGASDEPVITPEEEVEAEAGEGPEAKRPDNVDNEPECRECHHYPLRVLPVTTHLLAGVRAITQNHTVRPCDRQVMKDGPEGKPVPVMPEFNCKGKKFTPA